MSIPGVGPVGADQPTAVVHVVAKTHLDLGFTGLATDVELRYLTAFFPKALDVAAVLRDRGGPERLVWTTGSWILHRALQGGGRAAGAVAAGIERGDLAWHALPVTTHTELMDAGLVRSGLGISSELDRRFDRAGPSRRTIAAKMTDVPGHTRSLVPLLAAAGVRFLHIGVNPAWPVPDVPPVFRWRSPDGSEVVVAYQAGGYGGTVRVPGCGEILTFLHAGDNLGPPSVGQVISTHRDLAATFPDAEIRASTLDDFARALFASGATADLPVVTAEIGDPWLFGAGSDPAKVAAYRHLLRTRLVERERLEADGEAVPAPFERVDRSLLLVAEHTWGLDQKEALPDTTHWDRPGLAKLRSTPEARRFERSWAEQRAYVTRAAQQLASLTARATGGTAPGRESRLVSPASPRVEATSVVGGVVRVGAVDEPAGDAAQVGSSAALYELIRPAPTPAPGPGRSPLDMDLDLEGAGVGDGAGRVKAGEPVSVGTWRFTVDSAGAVVGLVDERSGRVLADADHPLGLVRYQSFDAADYERFYAGLAPTPDDEWWARWDNTKPGIETTAAARSGLWTPTVTDIAVSLSVSGSMGGTSAAPMAGPVATPRTGAMTGAMAGAGNGPMPSLWIQVRFTDELSEELGAPPQAWICWEVGPNLTASLWWDHKPANRLPEALWWTFNPPVDHPENWTMDKLGQPVSPLDVVRRGGRSLHAVGEGGLTYQGPDGELRLGTPDAPLVAPGRPNLLDADPPVPAMSGGWHILLADNCWGTNFPMWIEGPARYRVTMSAAVTSGPDLGS